ncbi:hypothetical protein BJ741DRAFT_593300 [Chytriomyces cf. hyalinus JEL632]|nr:hypothetical protein BJ741DRAFT_593300 [Chytriomyces cf. hyalinus JEL632]
METSPTNGTAVETTVASLLESVPACMRECTTANPDSICDNLILLSVCFSGKDGCPAGDLYTAASILRGLSRSCTLLSPTTYSETTASASSTSTRSQRPIKPTTSTLRTIRTLPAVIIPEPPAKNQISLDPVVRPIIIAAAVLILFGLLVLKHRHVERKSREALVLRLPTVVTRRRRPPPPYAGTDAGSSNSDVPVVPAGNSESQVESGHFLLSSAPRKYVYFPSRDRV